MSTGARRILANTGYRLLADAGSKVASLAFFVVMARQLGEADFGVFSFGLAFALLVTTFGNFGQDSVLTREVARDRTLLDHYFANTLAIKIVLSVACLAVSIGVATAAGMDAQTRNVAVLLGLAVILELLMATCFGAYQAFERLEFVAVALISQRSATAAAGIVALLAGAGVEAVAAIYLGGAALGFTLAAALLLRRVARPRLVIEPRSWWPLMRAAVAIGVAAVFAVVLFRVDTTMLAAFKPKHVVGDYGAAYRLFEATLFVSWSVGAAVYPVFSRLSRTTVPPVGFVFERGLKLVVALTLPLAAGAAVLAEPLVKVLYGSEYGDAVNALRLLSPAIALYPLCYLGAYLLVAQDRQRVLTIVYGLVAVENIGLNFVLIPKLSLNGAALGTSLSQFLIAAPFIVLAQRIAGRLEWTRVATGPVLATLAAAGAMLVLKNNLAVAVPAGAAVYVTVLVLLERRLFPDDARAVFDLLPRLTGRDRAAT